jgi:hypothetical protein
MLGLLADSRVRALSRQGRLTAQSDFPGAIHFQNLNWNLIPFLNHISNSPYALVIQL